MFSTPSFQNQLLAQLSQLSYGVLSTATSPGVRSNTSKTAYRLGLHSRQKQAFTPAVNESSTPISNTTAWADKTSTESLESVDEAVSTLSAQNSEELSDELASKILLAASNNIFSDLSQQLDTTSASLQTGYVYKLWDDVLKIIQESNIWESPSLRASIETGDTKTLMTMLETKSSRSPRDYMNEYQPSSFLGRTYFKSLGSFELDRRFSPSSSHPSSLRSTFAHVPFRTFKTDRGQTAEEKRNPSFLTRLKNKLLPPFPPTPAQEAQAGGMNQQFANPQQQEKLRALVAELPPDEASKIKVAFAEGYMAANPTQQQGSTRAYRWLRTLQQVLAIAVFTAILASLMGSFGGGMFRVNVGNGNEVQPEDIKVTFNDVKGVDEAKQELQEVVEFLRSPEKFVQLGGKLPKGVLLVGPPGTGKTLLARAVAGEAGVPFFHAAGPEFDEILVGQGARRVRDLFKAAKVKAPCVIFIDEIDSVGAKRTNSVLHPYANQTINQLLTEMDGFRQNEGVIVLGATNRREDLDKALLRPGRFDVEVNVPAPEYTGRKEILDYYLGRVKKSDDVDVDILARGTTGFTGADLENMVNQAALRAAIEGADKVFKKHLDFARDKVIMGPERKTRIPDEEANRITAYHEGGHALVAHYTKDSNPLHKVTIIPRGHSLGHTAYIPEKEQYHVTRSQLMAMMDTMMGGRAAEELIFGIEKITSGASSDLKQATAIASQMVKRWGMSEKVGLRTVEDQSQSLVAVNELGPQTSELIDQEIKRILQDSYDRAKAILKLHAREHRDLAEALIKYETLDADDVKAIFAGNPKLINKPSVLGKIPTPPVSPPPPAVVPPMPGIPGFTKPNPCP